MEPYLGFVGDLCGVHEGVDILVLFLRFWLVCTQYNQCDDAVELKTSTGFSYRA